MTFSTVFSAHVIRIAGWRRMFRAVTLSAMALCAQSGDWARVQALVPGSQVDVKRFSGGGEVRGTVESVSEKGLAVRTGAATVSFDRSEVRRVRLRSNEKSKRGRIAGTAILGTLGLSAVAVSDRKPGGRGIGRLAPALVYGGIGYLIGWAADGPKRITIFRAPKP